MFREMSPHMEVLDAPIFNIYIGAASDNRNRQRLSQCIDKIPLNGFSVMHMLRGDRLMVSRIRV